MFGLFKKKPQYLKILDDKIWITRARYYKGIFKDAKELSQAGRIVIITHFFPKSCEELAFVLNNAGLEFVSISDLGTANMQVGKIYLTLADSILGFKKTRNLQTTPISILVAGHYPISSKQEMLETQLKTAESGAMEITYYNSMDSEIFQLFGGDRIMETMKKMGVGADEQISHSMISKSIKRAQLRIAESVHQEKIAQSEKEWFEVNNINP